MGKMNYAHSDARIDPQEKFRLAVMSVETSK